MSDVPFEIGVQSLETHPLPTGPGIYLIHDASGTLIYVGKAKNLRRRLFQYKNARRTRKHAKMRKILAAAHLIRIEPLADERAALLKELEWIQRARPRFNVAGAYSFMYPHLAIRVESGAVALAFTTDLDLLTDRADWRVFGCYRSRRATKDFFFQLVDLLGYLGHTEPTAPRPARPRTAAERGTSFRRFRNLPPALVAELPALLAGESAEFLESLTWALLEHAGARARARETTEQLKGLRKFFRRECRPIKRLRAALEGDVAYVAQRDRDRARILNSDLD